MPISLSFFKRRRQRRSTRQRSQLCSLSVDGDTHPRCVLARSFALQPGSPALLAGRGSGAENASGTTYAMRHDTPIPREALRTATATTMGPNWFNCWATITLAMQRWLLACTYSLACPPISARTLQRPDGTAWRVATMPDRRVVRIWRLPLSRGRRSPGLGAGSPDNVVLFLESQARAGQR